MSGFDPQRRRSIIASSSRNSSPSSTGGGSVHNEAAISLELKVNARAQVQGKIGTIRFVGTTSFQTGKWVGIELDEPQGKNSGVVQGKRYFECKTNHGVFVRPSQVKVISEEQESPDEVDMNVSPSISERARFAPAQDPNLTAARNIQQHMPASSNSSTTLLPSRITSPSRISRLPLTPTSNKKTSLVNNRKSASPTASITSASPRKSKVASPTTTTRPRSNTSSQKDAKENKLLQLRLQQQERLALIQQQQQQQQEILDQQQLQQQQEEEEEEAELQRQLQEEECLAAQAAAIAAETSQSDMDDRASSVFDTESNDTSSDRGGVGLVSTTSSTAMPTNTAATARMSQQQSYGSLAANLPVSKSDQMIPLKDYEELRLKLKILESKRQEDRERYREHEKVKEEAEQFLTLRNKLQGMTIIILWS